MAGDDAQALALTLSALKAADVSGYRIQLGDLGLFTALLASIDMPQRWRTRLQRQFWRPRAFRDLLNQLTGQKPKPRTSISDLLDEMANSERDAVSFVEHQLESSGLEMIAGRTIEQVAARLSEKLLDRSEPALSDEQAGLIDDYLSIRCPPLQAIGKLKQIGDKTGGELAHAIELFEARAAAMEDAGLPTGDMEFAAVFGRSLEYYTGFVFQIDHPLADGASETIAGGGRYDTMLKDIGADAMIPAVGCAIYASRVLSIRGAKS